MEGSVGREGGSERKGEGEGKRRGGRLEGLKGGEDDLREAKEGEGRNRRSVVKKID